MYPVIPPDDQVYDTYWIQADGSRIAVRVEDRTIAFLRPTMVIAAMTMFPMPAGPTQLRVTVEEGGSLIGVVEYESDEEDIQAEVQQNRIKVAIWRWDPGAGAWDSIT